MSPQIVSGEITFDPEVLLPSGAEAHVTLLETSRADGPAQLITEKVIPGIAELVNQGKPVPFVLPGVVTDQRGSYTVSVHVDLDGDGQVGEGDFITMQSYPVLTYGNPSRVSVRVREV